MHPRPEQQDSLVLKRQRVDTPNDQQLTTTAPKRQLVKQVKRVSDLTAPIMLLTGHQGEVHTLQFSPDGKTLASVLWNASGECQNTQVIKGHTGCILELQWARDGASIFTASTDKTCGQFDVETGARIKKFKGHTGIINTCSVIRRGSELLASGADEGHVKVWDPRQKLAIKSLNAQLPVLAVSFSLDGGLLFSSGIDGDIKAWDLRKDTVSYSMSGHTDTVTGLRLSPDGDALLSYSMDNTARIWDVKPFAVTGSRLLKTFEGAPHGYEKNVIRPCWSPDSDFIATGCGDRSVMIWNASTGRIAYKLPGHKGCVNQVDWTGTILASGSSDRNIFVGELNLNEVK